MFIFEIRGSKYLDYETWKLFLEELAYRKRLAIEMIQEKLLAAGKPAPNQISVKAGTQIFTVYQPPLQHKQHIFGAATPPEFRYMRTLI